MNAQAVQPLAVDALHGLLRRPMQPDAQTTIERCRREIQPPAVRQTCCEPDDNAADSIMAGESAHQIAGARRMARIERQPVTLGGGGQHSRRHDRHGVEPGPDVEVFRLDHE